MKIGYAKLGRSISLDLSSGDMAGNAEAYNVLMRLAARHSEHEFYIIGKNNGKGTDRLPRNVINLWDVPDGISRSPWVHSNGKYRCAFCKTEVGVSQWALDCCDRARECEAVEEYIKVMTLRMDALIMHVGQHGILHAPIPPAPNKWSEGIFATPYAWARNYGHYLIDAVNRWCDVRDGGKGKLVWLDPDPRNFMKARDIKWPTGTTEEEPILSQYEFVRDAKHERYLDMRTPQELGFKAELLVDGEVWKVDHHYRYSGLELAILPDDWATWGSRPFADRDPVAVATTAPFLPDVRVRRSVYVQRWIFDNWPDAKVYGKWSDKSLADVTGTVIENNPLQFPDLLGSSRVTVSLPPSGTLSGLNWVVAKPYQCYAANTACFFIPPVDSQGWVLPNTRQVDGSHRVADDLWSVRDDWTPDELQLARWMRVDTPEQLKKRADAINADATTWWWVVGTQRALLQRRWDEKLLETLIEQRLGL